MMKQGRAACPSPQTRGVSAVGLTYADAIIPNPTITLIRAIHSATSAGTCTITAILGTAVA